MAALVSFFLTLILSPFLFGIINRTKAFFAGRKGSPLLQMYYDIAKLLRKDAVYSRTVTWVFFAGPIGGLAAVLLALALVPFAGRPSVFSFDGDLVLFIYLLGLARFLIVLSALDTGSSFEGMGSSREVQFAVFIEPALFLSLAALARATGRLSIADIFLHFTIGSWAVAKPALFLAAGAMFMIFLAENARIPVDDPNTHLELTMIHEVMVLDHSGVDFAYILYGAAVKFWLLGALLAGMVFNARSHGWFFDGVIFFSGMAALAVVTGVVESVMARLRLLKVPHFLIIALALSVLAIVFTIG